MSLNPEVRGSGTGLDDVRLPYDALFSVTPAELNTQSSIAGIPIGFPLMFGAMTGGTPEAASFNSVLRNLAAKYDLAMELGSIRACLNHPELLETYGNGRVRALFANIGASEITSNNADILAKTCEKLGASGLCIHLNGLQEYVQDGGNHAFSCNPDVLASFIARFPMPVLVKEVGSGIGGKCAKTLAKLNVAGIETASLGGTSWIQIEALRRKEPLSEMTIRALNSLGYDMQTSIKDCREALGPHKTLIASGGVQRPDELIKCLYLGADCAAIAQPLYRIWQQNGTEALERFIDEWIETSKLIWRSTGCKSIQELKSNSN